MRWESVNLGLLLIIALILICPISMWWMMRARHGRHGRGMHDRMNEGKDRDMGRDPQHGAQPGTERSDKVAGDQRRGA